MNAPPPIAPRRSARPLVLPVAAATLLAHAALAHAAVIYNEPLQADLSDNYLAPTPLTVTSGINEFFGACEGDTDGSIDRDYFTITIPMGFELAGLNLTFYESLDFAAFLGLSAGPQFSVHPDAAIITDPLGWVLISQQEVGLDILPLMAANGQTFGIPLRSGTYTFWAQQMGEYTEYALELLITPVPAPGASALMAAAALCAARRHRIDGAA